MRQRRAKAAQTEKATIAYVRVSTEDQATMGVSLDDQQGRLRAFSEAMAWDGLEVVVDAGESAKSLQRPGITTVLERVRRGEIARVIVTKLDRLTRSTRDLADLLDLFAKQGVSLVSIAESLDSGSAAGRLVVNMLGVVAQWEREAIAERTSTALSHKRRTGTAYGPTPFGFRRVGDTLVRDDCEQDALAEAVRLDRAGASYREIGRMLDDRGVRPHRGAAWHASSVRAVLRSRSTAEAFAA
jgi:DNA invertase Pin-like site-specific DNA recombinase